MKIGMVVPHAGFAGGIEKYAFDVSRGLRERGHHLTLIYLDQNGRDRQDYAKAFNDVRAADADDAAHNLDIVYVQRAGSVEELQRFRGLPVVVASHDHDLTCPRSHRYLPLTHEPCHRPPGFDCVRFGCVVVRDRRPGARLPVRLTNPFTLQRNLVELAARTRLVACSHYVADNLRKAGVPPQRVEVIHPIPPEQDAPLAELGSERVLLVVGQLLRGKGFDLAIDALGHLPKDIQLVVAGDGPSKADLRREAERVAPGRVRFLGYVPPEKLPSIYDDAHVVVVPSMWPEPFGMVGIEAMRRARPVVAAKHGGIPEWLKEPDAGRLFEPKNPASLARAVEAVLSDRESGTRAHAYVRKTFVHATMIDNVEKMLERSRKDDPL